jgi:hypothetical protein
MIASDPPQPPQNFSPGSFTKAQFAHDTVNAAPQCAQYRRPARLSDPQFAHACRPPSLIDRSIGLSARGRFPAQATSSPHPAET